MAKTKGIREGLPLRILQLNVEALTANKLDIVEPLVTLHNATSSYRKPTAKPWENLLLITISRNGRIHYKQETWPCLLRQKQPIVEAIRFFWRRFRYRVACINVEGYNIINIYKPPFSQMTLISLPVFDTYCI